jgi:hypothetical protein
VICTLTARRLKPGTYEQFREAWMPRDAPPAGLERWNPVYVCRDVSDENVVLTFGMFQGTQDELRVAQRELDYDAQVQSIAPSVEEVLFDGAFEVVEELRS